MEVRVVFDKSPAVFAPGESVRGRVILLKSGLSLLPKPTGLKIQFDGKAQVKFVVTDRWGYNYKARWRTHQASETYFHTSYYLLGNGEDEEPELCGAGVEEFSFAYSLPPLLPSSFKGTHGSVEYSVTATLKRAWGPSKEVVVPFQVETELDVASYQYISQNRSRADIASASMRRSERVGMLWWKGTVFVHLSLRKKAYLPGEFVLFSAQVINDSKSNLHKAKLLLTQEVKFSAQTGDHVVTHILKKVKGPSLKNGERRITWDDPQALKVPQITPTNLGGSGFCALIEVNYFIHLIVQPSSLTWKDSTVLCKLPITIGTVRSAGARSSWCGTDRVGFSTSLERGMSPADLSYYQNVVFPLNRCFSAPLYENHRFSPYPIQEEDPLEPPEPPPSYEEAMESYQNLGAASRDSSVSTVIQQPLYNNALSSEE